MLTSFRAEFTLQRKWIQNLLNKRDAIECQWNSKMIVFIQLSVGNVIGNVVCLHHTRRHLGLADFLFLPLLLLFTFPPTCFSVPYPDMIAPLLIRLSSSPLASNVSSLFFVLLLTRSIWKWIPSVGSSQFFILLLTKTLRVYRYFKFLNNAFAQLDCWLLCKARAVRINTSTV